MNHWCSAGRLGQLAGERGLARTARSVDRNQSQRPRLGQDRCNELIEIHGQSIVAPEHRGVTIVRVIVVVEGPSAAGKTTWCSAQVYEHVIAETGRVAPPAELSDDGLAGFWHDLNCRRWATAMDVETQYGLAVCDTDPLKLHYDYCLARVGVASWDRFDAGAALAAEAIASRALGIAGIVLVNIPDDETLSQQRSSDPAGPSSPLPSTIRAQGSPTYHAKSVGSRRGRPHA